MGIFELFILAVGLSMDAFAVAICKGLATTKLKPKHMLITGAWFGGFQALMPLIGYFLGTAFAKYVTLDNYNSVWEMTGHYPVQLQNGADAKASVAYHAYERAIPAPNSQDAGGFWIHIKEIITAIMKEQL